MSWVLPPDKTLAVLVWASMPRAVWDTLCIPHRIAVVELWLVANESDEDGYLGSRL